MLESRWGRYVRVASITSSCAGLVLEPGWCARDSDNGVPQRQSLERAGGRWWSELASWSQAGKLKIV